MEVKNSSEVAMNRVSTATPIKPQQPKVQAPATAEIKSDANYSFDKEANMFVVKFTDPTAFTGDKVVKQYPPEAMVELAKELNKMAGNVIDTKA